MGKRADKFGCSYMEPVTRAFRHETTFRSASESDSNGGFDPMKLPRPAIVLALSLALGGASLAPAVAQDNTATQDNATQNNKETRKQLKAGKDQAKADKAERKALNTKEQKKADKAQDK